MKNEVKDSQSLITESVGFGDQYAIFERIFSFGDKKLKIAIKSDAYDIQSYARMYIFSPTLMQWNILNDIHYSLMATEHKLYSKKSRVTVANFENDAKKLTDIAKQILS